VANTDLLAQSIEYPTSVKLGIEAEDLSIAARLTARKASQPEYAFPRGCREESAAGLPNNKPS
jgi:hypothetical protein